MIIEIINTGTELMLGRVLNTHQQWLCRQLADRGYTAARQVAVPDLGEDIQQAVREALSRADLIITTGGLGPTSDDITRELIAQLLGTTLREDAGVLAHIENFFAVRKRPVPPKTLVQALVPAGAMVLPNPHGTAPGLAMKVKPNPFRPCGESSWLILLPGPPRELRPMFTDSVVPLLHRVLPQKTAFVCRTLRTTGIGESAVQERIGGPLQRLINAGLELGYCARPSQTDVRLSARGSEANALVQEAETIVRERLGLHIFGDDDEDLEEVVVRLLAERKLTLAVAESCTGGYLAHRLTNVSGASAVLLAGLVTYSNEAKQRLLGVRADTLGEQGAVSNAVAREMAESARRVNSTTYALSLTGIAGPTGGTTAKPIGTVFIGLASPAETTVEQNLNPCDRETFKQVATNQALDMLRRALIGLTQARQINGSVSQPYA